MGEEVEDQGTCRNRFGWAVGVVVVVVDDGGSKRNYDQTLRTTPTDVAIPTLIYKIYSFESRACPVKNQKNKS